MSYEAEFKGWDKLTLQDLIIAYRKAKADCYFEKMFPNAIKFAEYEENLITKLNSLLDTLKKDWGFQEKTAFLGEVMLVPKKLGIRNTTSVPKNQLYFSDPERAFKNLFKNNEVIPEFRVIGNFPVDAHILSALWINMVGRKLDSCLSDNCYSFRLKRVRNDQNKKDFHLSAIGSFEPYFRPYKTWRNDGFSAIRKELENNKSVIAICFDLKNYYHFIDPMVLDSKELHRGLGLKLNDDEIDFTNQLAMFLKQWSQKAEEFINKITKDPKDARGGLVIGLSAAQIVSNVLLYKWDKLLKKKLSPIFYGRYADDMFLVLQDPGSIYDIPDLMNFLKKQIGSMFLKQEKNGHCWHIHLGEKYQKNSKLIIQEDKQKLFILKGQSGLDLIELIQKDIRELSSELRLMPSPEHLEDSTAARVLCTTGDTQADALRRTDGLTIRRLSWSLQMNHIENLAQDLPPITWKNERVEFYKFAHNHVLRSENIFEHYFYLPRLLGFAVSLNEWEEAKEIVNNTFKSLKNLARKFKKGKKVYINGILCNVGQDLWRYMNGSLSWVFIDSIARYLDPKIFLNISTESKQEIQTLLKKVYDSKDLELLNWKPYLEYGLELIGNFFSKARLLAASDLSKYPYKKLIAEHPLINSDNKGLNIEVFKSFDKADLLVLDNLKEFIKLRNRSSRFEWTRRKELRKENFLPYLFPTRPYTPTEIAELIPQCVGINCSPEENASEIWAKFVKVLRGVWVNPDLLNIKLVTQRKNKNPQRLDIGNQIRNKVVIALTNIRTDTEDWDAMAGGDSNLQLERYKRLAEIVNQAIKLQPKPDYLLFPELSIPVKWVENVANKLTSSGISLIAGTEYNLFSNNEILSETCLILKDDRLGFPSYVKIWQPKLAPAIQEEEELLRRFGRYWYYPGTGKKSRLKPPKPIYNHNNFCFAVMVCSELQNSKARVKFQGEIDSLIVLSWNKDLDTFSALVEASTLDLHTYTILVNNRLYGDSRVRTPAKEHYKRDLARLRGGDNDYCVIVTLDIDQLRAFQSKAKRWVKKNDPFKPVPEGFKISKYRRKLPPK